jgi:hypothetical protein
VLLCRARQSPFADLHPQRIHPANFPATLELHLSFGLPVAKKPIKLTIYAPVNISFPSVARLAIDDKRYATGRTDLASLSARRVRADLEIKEELLKRWRAQVG